MSTDDRQQPATMDAEFDIKLRRHSALGQEIWTANISSGTHRYRIEGSQHSFDAGVDEIVPVMIGEIRKWLQNRKSIENQQKPE